MPRRRKERCSWENLKKPDLGKDEADSKMLTFFTYVEDSCEILMGYSDK